MKKFLLSLMLTGALLMPALAMAKAYVNGIDANYPPFGYIDEKTGEPSGFDVESMNWIAKKMGFEVTHQPVAWDGILPALNAGQIDMVASGMSITEKRKQVADFSIPYWQVSRVFLTRADSDLTPEKILKSKIQLGVQRGTSEADAIKQEQKEIGYLFTLRYYESAPLAVEDLLNKRIDAILLDQLPADDSIAKGKAVKKVGTHGAQDDFGVAFRKGDDELRDLVNKGYALLKKDPYWQELIAKYLKK